MKILILGGDGFCDWPTALRLSALGHDIATVDNLLRCCIDVELECDSLAPIRPMGERLRAWKDVSDKNIAFHRFDVAENYQRLLDLLRDWQPHAGSDQVAGTGKSGNATLTAVAERFGRDLSSISRNVATV